MEAAGGVQFNLYLRRCDKKRVRDISVSTPVDVELRNGEEVPEVNPAGDNLSWRKNIDYIVPLTRNEYMKEMSSAAQYNKELQDDYEDANGVKGYVACRGRGGYGGANGENNNDGSGRWGGNGKNGEYIKYGPIRMPAAEYLGYTPLVADVGDNCMADVGDEGLFGHVDWRGEEWSKWGYWDSGYPAGRGEER
jgi:hypothetical protein